MLKKIRHLWIGDFWETKGDIWERSRAFFFYRVIGLLFLGDFLTIPLFFINFNIKIFLFWCSSQILYASHLLWMKYSKNTITPIASFGYLYALVGVGVSIVAACGAVYTTEILFTIIELVIILFTLNLRVYVIFFLLNMIKYVGLHVLKSMAFIQNNCIGYSQSEATSINEYYYFIPLTVLGFTLFEFIKYTRSYLEHNNILMNRQNVLVNEGFQALWLYDKNGVLLNSDTKGKELTKLFLGREYKEGDSIVSLKDTPYEIIYNLFLDCLKNRKTIRIELSFPLQNLKTFWFDMKFSPTFNTKSEIESIIIAAIDTTSKKEYEQKILDEIKKTKAIIDNTPHILCAVDKDFKITLYNKQFRNVFEQFTGLQDYIGYDIIIFCPEEHKKDIHTNMLKALKGETVIVEYSFNWENSLAYTLNFYGPITDNDGSITGIVILTENITARKLNEINLIKAKEETDLALKSRSAFFSSVSHEIRTPMNAIIGLSRLTLDSKEIQGQSLENIKSINIAAKNLLQIINDLLDYSKMDADRLKLEEINFSFEDFLNEISQSASVLIGDKPIQFQLEVEKDIPKNLFGDSVRLNQIFLNLISNAVKFTDKGKVILKIKTIRKEKTFHEFEIQVIDTGIGIPEDKIDTIFERFTQTHDNTKKYGGTGLGLSIVQKLVELMGGKIFVESKQNQWTKFTVRISLKLSKDVKEDRIELIESSSFQGMRVLAVDDNEMNLFIISQLLNKYKIEFGICKSGLETIKELSQNQYDLVLLDLNMPDMDGMEVHDAIRNEKSSVLQKQIPIVLLTADAFEETRTMALEAGMEDFLTKPIDQVKLIKVLKKYSPAQK
ncbi:MAG: ATP-binding protein [Leptospiraceae bacterium]|nr:ATP-binding protein [Leptospiraceae bacterium]